MPEQEQGDGDIGSGEEATPDTEAAAPLNREQRRAQAKGKKGAGGANPSLPHAQNMRGPGTRGAAPGGASRFQRKTGGK